MQGRLGTLETGTCLIVFLLGDRSVSKKVAERCMVSFA
jgi:hypothetical protein